MKEKMDERGRRGVLGNWEKGGGKGGLKFPHTKVVYRHRTSSAMCTFGTCIHINTLTNA